MNKSRLPVAFWILIGGSILVVLVLVVGLVSENWKEISSAIKIPKIAKEKNVSEKEAEESEEKEDRDPETKPTPKSVERKDPDQEPTCEIEDEGEVRDGDQVPRLLAWEEPPSLLRGVSKEGKLGFFRLSISKNDVGISSAGGELFQPICGEKAEAGTCIEPGMFHGERQRIEPTAWQDQVSLWQGEDFGWLAILKNPNKKIFLRGPLGFCGEAFSQDAKFGSVGLEFRQDLWALDQGILSFFRSDKWTFSSLRRPPVHPDHALVWNGRGWGTGSCGDRDGDLEDVEDVVSFGPWVVTLAEGRKGRAATLSRWGGDALVGPLWRSDIFGVGEAITISSPSSRFFAVGLGSGGKAKSLLLLNEVDKEGHVEAVRRVPKVTTPRALFSIEGLGQKEGIPSLLVLEGRSTFGFSRPTPVMLVDKTVYKVPAFNNGLFSESPREIFWKELDSHRHLFVYRKKPGSMLLWRSINCH